jgi:hypothetical protein
VKTFFCALALALIAAVPGRAATITMSDGGSYTLTPGDAYLFSTALATSNTPGKVSFTLTASAASAPFVVDATVGSIKIFGNLTNPVLSWSTGSTLLAQTALTPLYSGPTLSGYTGSLAEPITAATLSQTLTLSWGKVTGSTYLAMSVTTVPIPAAGAMLAAALGGLALIRRRTRSAAA